MKNRLKVNAEIKDLYKVKEDITVELQKLEIKMENLKTKEMLNP